MSLNPFSPHPETDACLEAGGELLRRADDNEETIRNRLDVYRENTEPVVEFYRERGQLEVVDAEGDIDAITGRLTTLLG